LTSRKTMKSGKGRHFIYLLIALGMLIYALPNLELSAPWSLMSVFGLIWIGFTLLVITANVNVLFFVSEEQREELARIKRSKAMLWERKLQQKAAARVSEQRRASGGQR